MGIRETLNDNSKVSTIVMGVIVAGLLALVVWQLSSLANHPADTVYADFYTTDEGQTYFAHSVEALPPFEYQGVTAHRAVVFQCGGGKPFVGYIQRFTEVAHDRMAELMGNDMSYSRALDSVRRELGEAAIQVKLVNEGDWVPIASPQGQQIVNGVKCPEGDGGTPLPVTP